MMKEGHYIGVTGITVADVNPVKKIIEDTFIGDGRVDLMAMAGFLVSNRTLNRDKTSLKYPKIAELSALLEATQSPKVFNTIHYNTQNGEDLSQEVLEVFKRVGDTSSLIDGIQLNLAWPGINQIADIKAAHPEIKLIFQYGPTMHEETNQVADKLASYADFVDYVLLDSSAGRGLDFTIEDMKRKYAFIKKSLPKKLVVFAGGISAYSVAERITELRKITEGERFSIDAETKLRIDDSKNKPLDLVNIRRYLQTAYQSLSK